MNCYTGILSSDGHCNDNNRHANVERTGDIVMCSLQFHVHILMTRGTKNHHILHHCTVYPQTVRNKYLLYLKILSYSNTTMICFGFIICINIKTYLSLKDVAMVMKMSTIRSHGRKQKQKRNMELLWRSYNTQIKCFQL